MLILTEKPNVAKDFAVALQAKFQNGFYKNENTIITNCIGHLYELAEPEFYDTKYKKWNIEDLPIIPQHFEYQKKEAVLKQIRLVTSLLKENKQDKIIIATDADREGEVIARIVLKQSGITDLSNCLRFWVSEALTTEVILTGLQNAKPLSNYNTLSSQGFARQHADWLIGMNFTRFLSIGNSTLFSVGRVQTAVLAAIAKRNYEVQKFVPVPYNELEAQIKDDNNTTVKAYLINRENNKTAFNLKSTYLQDAISFCNNKKITNSEIKIIPRVNKPEKLLNINALQKLAYKQFGYSPDKTLNLAQSLYETHKCLSYPRTPSRVMGDDNVDLFLQKFELLKNEYPTISKYSKSSLITKNNKHIFDSSKLEAHHALIPLAKLPIECSSEEKNVFSIVIENFFSVCMEDCKYNEKQIVFYINNFAFKTTLKEIIQKGFKSIDRRNVTAMENTDPEQEIISFNETNCMVSKISILDKKTQPQKEFSIDTLLSYMEKPTSESEEKLLGLGTPATRADIIKKLFATGYIEETKKKLFATDKGIFLLKELAKEPELAKIANVSQTTHWEEELSSNPAAFEINIKNYINSSIKPELKSKYQKQAIGICPLCGNEIKEGKINYYCSAYKNDKPCKFVLWKSIFGTKLTNFDIKALLCNKRTKLKTCKTKEGKIFKAYIKLDTKGNIQLVFPQK